jgi:hypothetical protein
MSNLFNKVTSAISVAAILATTVGSSIVAAADGKLPYAEALATAGFIQSQSNEAGYRLSDTATRQEVAGTALKAFLGTGATLPESYTCKNYFSDVSSTKPASWSCRAVELAADNNIVTKANATFRPTANITRAEALAMVLKGAKIAIPTATSSSFNDVKEAWQVNVTEAALSKKIISANASFNPGASVTRWELFVFAANALGLSVDDLGIGDILNGLGGTGSTNTGATNTGTTVVKAGDLNLALNPASPANGTQVPKAGIVRFAVVDFTAASSDVSLNTIEIGKAGLASVDSSTKVWFEKNGVRVSGKASFSSDNVAVISFAPALVIKAGATESLDLYVELNTTSGNDYQFVSKAVNSTAVNVAGSFTTPVLRTADYTVTTAVITAQNTLGGQYNANNDSVELAKFSVANQKPAGVNDTRDLNFKSITLFQSGSANVTNLSNITLERNGVVVSSGVTISGKTVTVALSDIIKDGATGIYTLKAVINNVEQTSDIYNFYLKNSSDINLVETTTAFRATVPTVMPVVAGLYTVNGGDVKFERDTTVALSQNAAPGTQDVVLLQGTITAKSAIQLEDINVNYSITGAVAQAASTVMNTVYLQIGTSTFSWTPSTNSANTVANFLGTATVNGTAPVKLYTKLRDNAPAGYTVKFGPINLASVITTKQYVSNQNNITSAIGSIEGINVSVNASTLNLTRTDGLGATKLAVGVKGQLVYGVKFSSTQGNPIQLSNLVVNTSGTSNYTNGLTSYTLYVNGVAKDTKSPLGATATFSNFNDTVSTTKSLDVQIKADFSDVTNTGTFNVTGITFSATDSLTSNNVAGASVPGALFTIAQGVATVSASDASPKKQLLLAGAQTQKLVAFKVTATNDAITLKDLVLTGTALSNVSNIRLLDSNMNQIGVASNASDTGATFANLDNASGSTIAVDKSPVFYVVADVNATTDVAGVQINVVVAGSDVKGSNGSTIAMSGVNVASLSHDIAQNTFKLAAAANASKELRTSAIRFTVTAAGKNNVTLTGITLNNLLSGYNTAAGQVKIYKGDLSTLVGSTALGTVTGPVLLNTNNTVDAGTTATFIVAVEGVTATGTTQDWSVSLTGLNVDTGVFGVDAANYPNNVDSLPLTSVK